MSAKSQRPDYIIIGRITKPHGVKGALKVEPITDDPSRFEKLERIHVGTEERPSDVVDIKKIQFQTKFVILTLNGVDSREHADNFRGQYVYVPIEEAIPLPDGSVYLFELFGFEVYTNKNEFVGTVKDVLELPANNMFIVENDGKEYLIPDVPDIVEHVNIDDGTIIIDPIEGLLT